MDKKSREIELSQQRTKLAIQRSVMATERTYSAWIRTGVSSVLAGLAIVKFIGEREAVQFYVVIIGVIFVLSGIFIFIIGYLNFKNNLKVLEYNIKDLTRLSTFLFLITLSMVVSAILILGLLFLN